jgi:hypothetical protein
MPASAQWKWRDAKGQTQYSDLPPPPGIPQSDILHRPASSRATEAASAASGVGSPALPPPTTVEPALQEKLQKEQQEKAAKAKAEDQRIAAQRAENCSRARGHLQALEQGARIGRMNAKGEREVLDDKGREEETRRARSVIASDCK